MKTVNCLQQKMRQTETIKKNNLIKEVIFNNDDDEKQKNKISLQ